MKIYKKIHLSKDVAKKHIAKLKKRNAKVALIALFNEKRIKPIKKRGVYVRNSVKPTSFLVEYSFPYKKISEDNFFLNTSGVWKIISVRNKAKNEFSKLIEKYGINYNSPSGSKYVTTKNGVYRYSDHWGRVASCHWDIRDYPSWLDKQKVFFLAYIEYTDLVNIK